MEGQTSKQSLAEAHSTQINQEQLFHELEQRFVKLKAEHTLQEAEHSSLKKEYKDAATECKELRTQVLQKDKEVHTVRQDNTQLQGNLKEVQNELSLALKTADRYKDELNALRVNLKDQASRIVEHQKSETLALQRAAEFEHMMAPLKCDVERLEKEKDIVQAHSDWLEKQLVEKTSSLRETQQLHSKKTYDLELKVKSLKEDLESVRQSEKNLKEQVASMKTTLREQQERTKIAETSLINSEDQFNKEISSQERLARLYKESADERSTRIKELEDSVSMLRESLQEAESNITKEREDIKIATEEIFHRQVEISEKKIRELEEELLKFKNEAKNATKLSTVTGQTPKKLQEVSEVSSTAVEAQLASQGITLKQLYDRVVSTEELYRKEKADKEKLEVYMSQIVKEIQEKAPLIVGQRMDYQRALVSHDQLSERLDTAMHELHESRKRVKELEEERMNRDKSSEALAMQVSDLSRQVQGLLKAQIGSSPDHPSNPQHTAIIPVSSDDVITENLVVFKDIKELQARNLQLLQVVRQLSSDAELRSDGLESSSKEIEAESVKSAIKQLEELKQERDRQKEMISAIVNQRDMYRVLLAQADRRYVTDESSDAISQEIAAVEDSASKRVTKRASLDLTESRMLRELQMEFDDYKKEKRENEAVQQENIDKLRAACSQAKLAGVQSEADARLAREQYQNIVLSKKACEEEIIRYRAKNAESASLILEHQKTICNLETKLDDLNAELRKVNQEVSSSQAQIQVLQNSEDRLTQMNKKLRTENESQVKLMDSIQRIELGLESKNSDERNRLNKELEIVQADFRQAIDKNNKLEMLLKNTQTQLNKEKEELLKELQERKSEFSELHTNHIKAKEQLSSSTEKNEMIKLQLDRLQEQIRKGVGAAAAEQVSTLEVSLTTAKKDLHASMEAQEQLRENVTHYKAIAEAHEKALSELSSASAKWKEEFQTKLNESETKFKTISEELQQSKKALHESVMECNKSKEEVEQLITQNRHEKEDIQTRIKELNINVESLTKRENALQEEISSQKNAFVEAQANYERELQLHAAEVSNGVKSRKSLVLKEKECQELQQQVASLTGKQVTSEKCWDQERSSLKKNIKESDERIKSLESQNALLYSQLEALTLQIKNTQDEKVLLTIRSTESKSGTPEGLIQHDKDLSELRTIISHLRKEKEISETKLEASRQESHRFSTQIQTLQRTVDILRSDLQKEVQRSQAPIRTDSEQAKFLAQIQQLNTYRESNVHLREENEKNVKKWKDLTEEVKKMQDQIEPLRKSETLLKGEVKVLKDEVQSATETGERWKNRVQQLVEKYHQVDPEEHRALVKKHKEAVNSVEGLQSEKMSLENKLKSLQEELNKKTEDVQNQEKETKNQLDNLKNQYERMKGFAKTWKTKAETVQKQFSEKNKLSEEKEKICSNLSSKIQDLETKLNASEKKVSDLENMKKQLEDKFSEAESKDTNPDMIKRQEADSLVKQAVKEAESKYSNAMAKYDAEVLKTTKLKDLNNKMVKQLKKQTADLKAASEAKQQDNSINTELDSSQCEKGTEPSKIVKLDVNSEVTVNSKTVPTPESSPKNNDQGKKSGLAIKRSPSPENKQIISLKPKEKDTTSSQEGKSIISNSNQGEAKPSEETKLQAPLKDTPVASDGVNTASKADSEQLTAEEKLRLHALRSMKQKVKAVTPDQTPNPPAESKMPFQAQSKLNPEAPAFGAGKSFGVFGSSMKTPSFGSSGSFGSTVAAPKFGLGNASAGTKSFGTGTAAPTFGNKSTPTAIFGSAKAGGTFQAVTSIFGKPATGIQNSQIDTSTLSETQEAGEQQKRQDRLARFKTQGTGAIKRAGTTLEVSSIKVAKTSDEKDASTVEVTNPTNNSKETEATVIENKTETTDTNSSSN